MKGNIKQSIKKGCAEACITYNRYKTYIQSAMCALAIISATTVGFAAKSPDAASITGQIIAIICNVFLVVGVILLAYSIGQLIMAFKNDDADSKTRASTVLVVAIVLIALKGIVSALNLTQYIGNDWTNMG